MTKVDMTVTATRDTDGLSLSTTSRGEKRTDFSDSLPKRAKKEKAVRRQETKLWIRIRLRF